jgi:hypothetical protein
MNLPSTSSNENQPRDTAFWAQDASPLKVERTPTGALNLNVEGRLYWLRAPCHAR